MKISRSELDQNIVSKIERLDSVVGNFTEEDKAGFLSYNGKDFVVRRVNDSSFRRVFSESQIRSMEDSLYRESGTIRNSFSSKFNQSNKASLAFRTQVVSPKEEVLFSSDSEIVLSRHDHKSMVFVNSKGVLVRIDTETGMTTGGVDMRKELSSNFAVTSVSAFDFLALEMYGDGVLVSTAGNGVLYYDFASKKMEVKFLENGVTMIRNLGSGLVMCAADRVDSNVMFFSFETGLKVESSSALKRGVFQGPALSDLYTDHLFVVGRPYAANTTRGLLHYWRRDKAGISFNNMDGLVFPGRDYVNHSIRHILVTEDSVYVSGLSDNSRLFVWQYDLKDLSKPFSEIHFDQVSFRSLEFVDFVDEFIVVGEGRRVYFLSADGSVQRNILLSSDAGSIFLKDRSRMLAVIGSKIVNVTLPEYNSSTEISLEVYKSDAPCNNIDVLVKGCDGSEKFSFIDSDSLSQIAPYYMANYQGKTIVKLVGVQSKAITMVISAPKGASVEGVAVSADRLFLK